MYETVEDSGRCYYIQSHMFFISGFCVTISSPVVKALKHFMWFDFFFSGKNKLQIAEDYFAALAGGQHPLDSYSKTFKISRHADPSTKPPILAVPQEIDIYFFYSFPSYKR